MSMTVRSGRSSRSVPPRKSKPKAIKRKRKSSSASSSTSKSLQVRERIRTAILRIPCGYVSTYGAVARAAGLPRGARQVARVLHRLLGLPWQRVLGSGGEIKLQGEHAMEQRFLLQAEGVRFRGRRVDMKQCEFKFSKRK